MKPYIRKVQYYETDMMGIAHHANYIHWMEEARIDFMDQLGMIRSLSPYSAINFIYSGIGYKDYLAEYADYRHISADGCQKTGEANLVDLRLHFVFQCTFQLVGVLKKVVDASEVLQEFHGSFFTYTFATGNIVGCITHECEQIDHLIGRLQSVFVAYFFGSHIFEPS